MPREETGRNYAGKGTRRRFPTDEKRTTEHTALLDGKDFALQLSNWPWYVRRKFFLLPQSRPFNGCKRFVFFDGGKVPSMSNYCTYLHLAAQSERLDAFTPETRLEMLCNVFYIQQRRWSCVGAVCLLLLWAPFMIPWSWCCPIRPPSCH